MRLSVITDEVSQELAVAVEFARAHGLDAVELRSVWDESIFDADAAQVLRMKGMLDEAGLEVCCLSLPFYKCDLDDMETRAAHIEKLGRALEHARILGAPYVRGFTFWAVEGQALPLDAIVAAYAPVIPMLEAAGVVMVLEFDPTLNAGTATTLAKVLTAIHSPWVRAVWDAGNLAFRPDGEASALGYALLRPWLAHVHIKDAVRTAQGGQAVKVGTGISDVAGQLEWLKADGYAGALSLETHYRLNRSIDEAQMRVPTGSAFSADGLGASEESMTALIGLMKEAQVR